MFMSMLARVTNRPPKPPIRPHLFTLGESDRFPRELWTQFLDTAHAHGWQKIDALAEACRMFIANPPTAPTTTDGRP